MGGQRLISGLGLSKLLEGDSNFIVLDSLVAEPNTKIFTFGKPLRISWFEGGSVAPLHRFADAGLLSKGCDWQHLKSRVGNTEFPRGGSKLRPLSARVGSGTFEGDSDALSSAINLDVFQRIRGAFWTGFSLDLDPKLASHADHKRTRTLGATQAAGAESFTAGGVKIWNTKSPRGLSIRTLAPGLENLCWRLVSILQGVARTGKAGHSVSCDL